MAVPMSPRRRRELAKKEPAYVSEFIKAVYPECTALRRMGSTEKTCLEAATKQIRLLRATVKSLQTRHEELRTAARAYLAGKNVDLAKCVEENGRP